MGDERPDCTEAYPAPVVDTAFTAFQAWRTWRAVQASEADYEGLPISRGTDAALGVSLSMVCFFSALYGL